MGLLLAPFIHLVLKLILVNERVACLRPTAAQSTRPSWSPREGYVIVRQLGSSIVLLGKLNVHVGESSGILWVTRSGLPDLNPTGSVSGLLC